MSLLRVARTRNEEQRISGVLVHGNNNFMQVIEGEELAVRTLYERILGDPRHKNVFKMADKAIDKRSFPEWAMAFRALPDREFSSLVSYWTPERLMRFTAAMNTVDSPLFEVMRALVVADK